MQAIFDITTVRSEHYPLNKLEEVDITIENILLRHLDRRGLSLVDYENVNNPMWIHESEQEQFTKDGQAHLMQSYLVDLNTISSLGIMLADVYAVLAKALIALESIALHQVHILDYYNPSMVTSYRPDPSENEENIHYISEIPSLKSFNSIDYSITMLDQWMPVLNEIKDEFNDEAVFRNDVYSLPCYCNNGLRLWKPNNIQMNYSRRASISNPLMTAFEEHNRIHQHLLKHQFCGLFHFLATFN